VVGEEPALREAGQQQLLDLVLGGRAPPAVLVADPREGLVLGLVDGPAGPRVALDLPVVEPAEEALHQLARGDHLDAQ
jgi:predicted aconitase with swiveling domain